MALSRSLTEFPLYVLKRLKSGMDISHNRAHSFVFLCVCVCVPIWSGTEMCILQLVRTTALPPFSSMSTMGLSAGSFSMRSLTSCSQTHVNKYVDASVLADKHALPLMQRTWKKSSCLSGLQKNGCLSTQEQAGRLSASVLIICSIRFCAMMSSNLKKKRKICLSSKY